MNSPIIARNSFWYGLETAVGLVSAVITSIVIARALGPVKLGHYTYIAWLVNISASIGALGVPAATYKYMGEYLGRGDESTARGIYRATFTLQALIATFLTLAAITIAALFTSPELRWTAILLSATMWPAMLVSIPSQANMAREDLFANVPSALVSHVVYIIGVTLTLTFNWDTVGLGASFLVMRTADLVVRIVPVTRWYRQIPATQMPQELRRRLISFSRQSMVLLLLSIIVWDRSEVIVLRYLSDIRQLAFYTVVFNVTERLRMLPLAFSTAAASSLMAQVGRDASRLTVMTSAVIRFLALFSVPINIGLSVLAGPIILLTYGDRYAPAIPLMTVAALFALPRIILMPINSLFSASDRQDVLIRWNLFMAVLNIALDFLLIPRFGAMGAVVANGVAQTAASVGLGWLASKHLDIEWPFSTLAKITVSGLAMALAVLFIPATGWRAVDLGLGALVGSIAFVIALRLTRAVERSDGVRLRHLGSRFPGILRPCFDWSIGVVVPSAPQEATRT